MSPRRLAVAATAAIISTGTAEAATVEITINKLVFAPTTIDARVGDRVVWTNKDALVHTATVKGGWDVAIPPRKSGRLVLTTAGIFDYFCRFHPNMKGRITVVP